MLLSLVELAAERVEGAAALTLPLDDIAARVMELYWPQTRPHPVVVPALRQATTKTSRIVSALLTLRRASAVRANEPLGVVKQTYPDFYSHALSAVGRALAMQPVPRLQRPGSGYRWSDYPRFLYDDSSFETERGWTRRGEVPVLRLLPGVADALARNAPALRLAVHDVWTREVASINSLLRDEGDLRAFLFGAERVDLSAIASGLRDSGANECFWCGRRLSGPVQVDHVIPWSHYPADDICNLVLTDPACNNDKRDRLVTAELIARWVGRDRRPLEQLAAELSWPFDPVRTAHVAGSAYRYLPVGLPVWAGRHSLLLFDLQQRSVVAAAVAQLAG